MKKIVAGVAMLMAAGGAFAANSHQQGKFSLGVDTNFLSPATTPQAAGLTVFAPADMITGKYMLSNNLALTGGLAFATYGSDANGTDFAFKVGVRNYLSAGDFSPFVGGRFSYGSYEDGDISGVEFAGEAGAEYFLAPQFSVEGTVSIGYSSIDDKTDPSGNTFTTSRLGTSRSAIGFNFYF